MTARALTARSGARVPVRLLAICTEVSLWTGALGVTALLAMNWTQARRARLTADRFSLQAAPTGSRMPAQGANENPLPPGTKVQSGDGAVLGRLEIPKVGLSVPVLENYDPATLKRGVGHIPGTAAPGGLGNLGLAGHRDTFLRPLRNVKTGMEVDVVTADGKYRYSIDSLDIVLPEQTEVLDIHGTPELTLITCYPFDYIGAAPKRFIVRAHLLSLDPS